MTMAQSAAPGNTAGQEAAVAGGVDNTANGWQAAIGGGGGDSAAGTEAVITAAGATRSGSGPPSAAAT